MVGGAGAAGGGASTGVPVGTKTPALGAVGATGGVPAGGPVCGGVPAPDSIAFIAPDEIPCAPAPAGCPEAIPDANDCARLGEPPCPSPAGDIVMGLPGAPETPGEIDPPPPGTWIPGDGAPGGVVGNGPPLPLQLALPAAGVVTCGPPWTVADPFPPPAQFEVPAVAGGDACAPAPCPLALPPAPPPLPLQFEPPAPGDDWLRSSVVSGRGDRGLSGFKPF